MARWRTRDPIALFQSLASERGLLGPDDVAAVERDSDAEIASAIAFAEGSPLEAVGDLAKDVYAPRAPT